MTVDFNTGKYSGGLESFGSIKHENSFCTSDRGDDSEFPADPSGDSLPNVKGRLQERLAFWNEIGAGNWVTRILREAYALPFTKEPEPASFNNNRSSQNNREFVTKEILGLFSSGRIREVDISEVHTANPLIVADNGEKLGLILDLDTYTSTCKSQSSNGMTSDWSNSFSIGVISFLSLIFGQDITTLISTPLIRRF